MRFQATLLLATVLLCVCVDTARSAGGREDDPPPPTNLDFPPDPNGPAAAVGYLPGSSGVTSSGEYTYRLPIAVPPGRAGVQPDLALQYRSRGGNGLVGVGWELAGLSQIARCARTIAADGAADGVDYDGFDRFCLDGQRLVAVNGNYGLDGTEYRTDRDTFTKVVSYASGPVGSAPTSFRVWLKSGLIQDYEAAPAMRLPPGDAPDDDPEQVTPLWLLSKVTDRHGNGYAIEYDIQSFGANPYGTTIRPSGIEYLGMGPDTKRRIDFTYETRPDDIHLYQNGVRQEVHERLTGVVITAPNPKISDKVWDYRLEYVASTTTDRSLLKSVHRCDSSDACLWAREFNWSQPERPNFEEIAVGAVEYPNPELMFDTALSVGDFDGDGIDDLLYQVDEDLDSSTYIRFGGQGPSGTLGDRILVSDDVPDLYYAGASDSRVVDLNGDGVDEFVYLPTYESKFKFTRWDPSTGTLKATGLELPGAFALQTVDLDGDALPEVVVHSGSGGWRMYQNLGNGQLGPEVVTQINGGCGLSARVTDLEGDGRGDVLGSCFWNVALKRDDNGQIAESNAWARYGSGFTLDANGDGLADAVEPDFEDTGIRLNTGRGFGLNEEDYTGSGPPAPDMWGGSNKVADIDGDGRGDIVQFWNEPIIELNVWLSRYDHFVQRPLQFAPGLP
ncbi:MAG: FG-GAP-like repeat-containing protein [Polyangiaceae bacterium]